MILAISAAVHGAAEASGHAEHAVGLGMEWVLVAVSVAVAVLGIIIARRFYLGPQTFVLPRQLAERLPMIYKLLLNKYWVDQIYDALIVVPIYRIAIFCWKVFDELIIDTLFVNGAAFSVELTGDLVRFTTTGNVRNYALAVALAVFALAAILW